MPASGRRAFLSYSARDKDEIQHLREALAARGVAATDDVLELRLADGEGALRDAIQGADAFVFYLTPASIAASWVRREVAWALEAGKLDPAYRLLLVARGFDRRALALLAGDGNLVTVELGADAPIESAAPAILEAPGLAPQADAGSDEDRERSLVAMRGLVGLLYKERARNPHVAEHRTRAALGEMLAALDAIERGVAAGRMDAAEAIPYVTSLESLVSSLDLPQELERIAAARRSLTMRLPAWGHARFVADREDTDRRYEAGDLAGALQGALALHQAAEEAGDAYPEAAYDRALASWNLGRMLSASGRAGDALGVLDEARRRLAALAADGNENAAAMEPPAIRARADALCALGRLDDAAAACEESAEREEARGSGRGVAVSRGQLGTVRLRQRRFPEALAAYEEAKRAFEALGELGAVATTWHQMGSVHEEDASLDAAEHAHRQALALEVARNDRAREAATLGQLGVLCWQQGRMEEAVSLLQQAIGRHHDLGDELREGADRSNLAGVYRHLGLLDEARDALQAALTLKQPHGHAAEPWKTYAALADTERDAGRPEAAQEARLRAITTYRAYRDAGGEPTDGATRFVARFGEALRTAGPAAARALLPDPADAPARFAPTLLALHAIAAGRRDAALADNPAHHPGGAVELALLLASLPAASPPEVLCPCGSDRPFRACHGAPDA
jgi:tetratricopeptide (TPR) repeat protein